MSIVQVDVTKAKKQIEMDTDKLPQAVYEYALTLGLKHLMNQGNTKITKTQYPKPEELQAKAWEAAQTRLEQIYAGKIRIMGGKGSSDKVPGVVMTEARRIARNLVKDEMKKQKIKVSYVAASEITKLANALIAANPAIVEQAKESIAAREKQIEGITGLEAVKAVPIDPKKVEAAEAAKTAAQNIASAAKAGQVVPRSKTTNA